MLLVDPIKLDQAEKRSRAVADVGDVLWERMKFLTEPDRLLVELIYQHNLSRRKAGRLVQLSAGSVTRKLRAIVNRLHDPMVVALLDSTCTLGPDHRRAGIHYFLQHQSIPQLMKSFDCSRREAESMIEYIRGWYRGISTSKR